MVVIPVSTEKKWFIENRHDNVRDYDRDYYMCNKSDLKDFGEFHNWLKQYKQ